MIHSPLALIPLALLVIAGWRWPYAALAFVLTGATPYYASLQVLGVETSGALTGLVFGSAGAVAMAKLLMSREARAKVFASPYFLLYAVFVFIWLFRWFTELPSSTTLEFAGDFGKRAPAFMIAFSALPFVGGLAITDRDGLVRLFRALAGLGLINIAILLVYWALGAGSIGPSWSHKWEPIHSLTGIMLSLDLGVGVLALFFATEQRRYSGGALVRWAAAIAVVALMLRIGQRGPFVFMVSAMLAHLALRARGSAIKKAIGAAAFLALVAVVLMEVQEYYGASRAVAAEKYTAEGNEDRLELIEMAVDWIAERPIEGWGSGLLGRPVGNGAWAYSHVMVLDALLETGIIGALPFLALYALAFARFGRAWRSSAEVDPTLKAIAVAFSYTMLEAQVSGHVSTAKHAWLFTGLLCGVASWVPKASAPRILPLGERAVPWPVRRRLPAPASARH